MELLLDLTEQAIIASVTFKVCNQLYHNLEWMLMLAVWVEKFTAMITADLDPFTKVGQKIGVTVSSMGKAKSLRGGTLLMTPLKGADGKTYAIAQGNLAVGGFGVEGADGSSMSVNIPTVGTISNGATVERMVEAPFINSENFVMNLHQGDFTTAIELLKKLIKCLVLLLKLLITLQFL